MDRHKVTAKGYINTVNGQMVSISAIFTSTNHTKQPNPWPNSSANRIANYSWLCACLGERKPFKGRLSTRGHLTSHSKSILGNLQYQCLPELLYSYRLMENLLLCVWKMDFLKSRNK